MKIIQIMEQDGYLYGLDDAGKLYKYISNLEYNKTTEMSEWVPVGWRPVPNVVLYQKWVS